MGRNSADVAVARIRTWASLQLAKELGDGELLRAYSSERDQTAFEVLVKRHGPLVLATCERVLHHNQDAEDAFQAVFIVLAKKAASLHKHRSLAGWLHQVGHRVALAARRAARRRRRHESEAKRMEPTNPAWEAAWREVQVLLDEEIQRLPGKYREPFVLCCLENLSSPLAARRLGVKEGTVWSRLADARKRLQSRLAKRGVALSAVLGAATLAPSKAAANMPVDLAASAVRAALASGKGAIQAGTVSKQVAALVRIAIWNPLLTNVKIGMMLVCGLAAFASAAGLYAPHGAPIEYPSPMSENKTVANQRPENNPPSPRADRFGDPLPLAALLRMGTVRLRENEAIASIAFSPDGRFLVSGRDDGLIRLWDPITGKAVRAIGGNPGRLLFQRDAILPPYPFMGRESGGDQDRLLSLAISPDGKVLASSGKKALWLRDIASGKEILKIPCTVPSPDLVSPIRQPDVPVVFSPDCQLVASETADQAIHVWEIATGKERLTVGQGEGEANALAFTPDGKALLAAGATKKVKMGLLRRWDIATGQQLRNLPIATDGPYQGFVFSPDRKTLAVEGTHVEEKKLPNGTSYRAVYRIHLFDVESARERLCLDGTLGPHSSNHGVAFALDSKVLASACGGGTIEIWDATTGKLRFQVQASAADERSVQGMSLAFSKDGLILACCPGSPAIQLWDMRTQRELLGKPDSHQCAITCLTYSPDGKLLCSASEDHTIRLWATDTGKQQFKFKETWPVHSLAFSPHGKILAASAPYYINLWDVSTGLAMHKYDLTAPGWSPHTYCQAFTSDGKNLLAVTSPTGWLSNLFLQGWEVSSAKEIINRRFQLGDSAKGPLRGSENDPKNTVQRAAIVPTGKTAALANSHTIYIADLATGRNICQLGGLQEITTIAYSPDGKMLVSGSGDKTVRLWELATGKEVLRVGGFDPISAIAFGQDGKTVAVATGWLDGKIHILEVATGKEVRLLQGHGSYVSSLAFAPNRKALASGQRDTTALVWNIAHSNRDSALVKSNLFAGELDKLWADMAGSDAAAAHRAIWTMVAAPEKAVNFLNHKLPAVPRATPERLRQLVADLDSSRFALREAASKELTRLGIEAHAVLRQALAGTLSTETRRRAEQILAVPAPTKIDSPDRLRRLRAIQVLEQIGSEESERILESLAQGAAGALETQEAKASLERLAKLPN